MAEHWNRTLEHTGDIIPLTYLIYNLNIRLSINFPYNIFGINKLVLFFLNTHVYNPAYKVNIIKKKMDFSIQKKYVRIDVFAEERYNILIKVV